MIRENHRAMHRKPPSFLKANFTLTSLCDVLKGNFDLIGIACFEVILSLSGRENDCQVSWIKEEDKNPFLDFIMSSARLECNKQLKHREACIVQQ